MGGQGSGGSNRRPAAIKRKEGRYIRKSGDGGDDDRFLLDDNHPYLKMKVPAYFDERRTLFWQKLYITVQGRNRLNSSAEALLEMAANAWGTFQEAAIRLAVEGYDIPDKKGSTKANLAIRVGRDSQKSFIEASNGLGIMPNQRLKLIRSGDRPIDWLEELEAAEAEAVAGGPRH